MHRILVVDDEKKIVMLVKEFLTKNDFDVLCAFSGKEAIAILESNTVIDMMLIDMRMPQITGADVIKKMYAINKAVPTIIITGTIDALIYLEELRDAGISGLELLTKPIDLFILLNKIKDKLNIKEQNDWL